MHAIIDLLVCLHRHEQTARMAAHQMSPGELLALKLQAALVRGTLPQYVLDHYDALKQSEPDLADCPAALAMATLVSVYRALPSHRRRALTSFFDLAGYSAPRRSGGRPRRGCRARQALATTR